VRVSVQVLIGVFVTIIVLGSGLSSYGNELIAQRTPIVPNSITGNYTISGQENSVCTGEESFSKLEDIDENSKNSNMCEPEHTVEIEAKPAPNSSSNYPVFNEADEDVSLLPNPEVEFIEDYMLEFNANKSRNTIFYGGVVPFVALPDAELSTEDSFFNDESFSFFLYFKRKF
jgi:hypothetical protein